MIVTSVFDTAADPTAKRVTAGLAKIGLVLRSRAWKGAGRERLTPTQGQILAVLRSRSAGMRLAGVAEALGATPATASDAVASLVEKSLVARRPAGDDGRAVTLTLTAKGRRQADRVAEWPDFLMRAVATLTEPEQALLLRALVKMIRTLQANGDIPIQRMCATCRFFRPKVHTDVAKPHHCAFVDAPFGDRHLRLDCADHDPALPPEASAIWSRFVRTEEEPPR